MINIIIYTVFFAILVALGIALFHLVKSKNSTLDSTKIAKALRMRIGLSIFLFLFLFFSFMMGWIKPHGINPVASVVLQPIDENK